MKSQSKIKDLNRELRNKDDECEEYVRKMDSMKNERRRSEKSLVEVSLNLKFGIILIC